MRTSGPLWKPWNLVWHRLGSQMKSARYLQFSPTPLDSTFHHVHLASPASGLLESSAAHPQALLVALLETPSPLFHNNNCSFLKPSSSGCQANGLTHQPQATYIISSSVSVITHNLLHMHRAFGWFLCVCVCFWFCKLT